jgi:Uncharacterized conserved protein
MRIGIDIDGVLTNESDFIRDFGSKFCYENNISCNLNPSIYDSKETFGISENDYLKFWGEYLEYYSSLDNMRPFASEVIKKLKNEGHEIYIITARNFTNKQTEFGEKMRNMVKSWLKENKIEYDDIYFSEDKKHICESLKIDVMVEDKPEKIIKVSEVSKVFCYNDYCNLDINIDNVIRVYSWYDIYDKIKRN